MTPDNSLMCLKTPTFGAYLLLLSPVHILIPYYSKHASKEATNQLTYSMGQSSSSETNVHSASEKKKSFMNMKVQYHVHILTF